MGALGLFMEGCIRVIVSSSFVLFDLLYCSVLLLFAIMSGME
jgi:hypothetical protein